MLKKLSKYLPVLLLLVAGCGDDEDVKKASDLEYFPLRTGFYQIYTIRETNYVNIESSTSDVYQLKTEVVDSFPNQEGEFTFTIHRSRRDTENDPWEFLEVWSVRRNSTRVVVSEENKPIIKLVFPVDLNRKWDGNALNTDVADEYVLTNVGKSLQLEGGFQLGNYVEISQEDSGDRFHVDKRQEFYVRNVGLVYRENRVLEYCSDADECDITQQVIDNGTIYVQTLIEYGQN